MFKNLKKEEKFILNGIPVLFILGALNHFIFKWSGSSAIIGCFSPVNECVWEHGKLGLIPIILWFGVYSLFKKEISKNAWFAAMTASIILEITIIPTLFYLYTGALGIESLFLDILIYLISITVGQIVAIYAYRRCSKFPTFVTITVSMLIVLMFIMYTFFPPKLPIFCDHNSNTYGIYAENDRA